MLTIFTHKTGPAVKYLLVMLITGAALFLASSEVSAGHPKLDPGRALEAYLGASYPWTEIQVSNVRTSGAKGNAQVRNIVVEKGPLGNGIFTFTLDDDSIMTVRAKVRAFGYIVKSKRAFRRGHRISENDIYLDKVDIRRMPGSALRDPAMAAGKVLKRSISANLPLEEGMIQLSAPVARGRMVTLLIHRGGLRITSTGQLKRKGYIGKPVKVINISSRKVVTGILIDENTVNVIL